jgi:peptidoglycan/LPS O-acetylase OafA/YrhL
MSAPPVSHRPASPADQRSGFIDLLKAVAAQLIVLHHLAFYGPMADHVQPIAPAFINWLDSHARIAVQVFLVIGGFLTAKALSPQGTPGISKPLDVVFRRFVKLVPPFFVATVLAAGASVWASQWMAHDSISATPTLQQLAAHALLLHGILGYESVSAGAWYVAIDFQLYTLMALMLWLSGSLAGNRRLPWIMPVLVAAGIGASLLYFNRDSGWDVWAPYFFGSYGFGVIAWWACDPARRPMTVCMLLGAILLISLVALIVDFRSRIAVALLIACALVSIGRSELLNSRWRLSRIGGLGRISYAIFLIHFPVCLIVNAAFTRFLPAQPLVQAAGMLLAWAASVAAGAAFYRWIEVPLSRFSVRPGGWRLSIVNLGIVIVALFKKRTRRSHR